MRVNLYLLFIIFIELLIPTKINSQSTGEVWYNVVSIPPSPNAAALGKYGEVPVSMVTGIPDISIPILNLSEGGINVPININYNAGGIRVSDESSWVGLGWSLNAGGVITRTMRGLPDEHTKGFLTNSEKVPWSALVSIDFNNPNKAAETYTLVDEIERGYRDFEPDAFYYNFGSYSGSFSFGNHKRVLCIPIDDIVIDPIIISGSILGFKLTDPNGIMYFFGDIDALGFTEQTSVSVKGPDQAPYISSWYLQKIVNPFTNTTINFSYNSYLYNHSASYSSTKLFELNPNNGNYDLVNSSTNQSIISILNARILSSISFPNGIVKFYNSESSDGGMKLDSISFKNKRFDFDYDYFQSTPFDNTKNTLRLKLQSLKERMGDNSYKIHSFKYSSVILPPKNSNSIDYWGFYNNKSNSTPIPKIVYAGCTFGDADRLPDPNYSNACILTSINYPTGGITNFTYENNKYSRLPSKEEISTSQSSNYYVTGSDVKTEICKTNDMDLLFDSKYKYWGFSIEASISISDMSQYNSLYDFGQIQIYDKEMNIIYSSIVKLNNPISVPISTDLSSNIYFIKICATGVVTTLIATLKYYKYDPNDLSNLIDINAGGLRIMQIQSFDPVSNKETIKTYDYCKSGYLNNILPPFYSTSIDRRSTSFYSSYDYQRLMVYSSPVGGLGASSNSVSYEKVIEYNGTLLNNSGKTVRVFNKEPDYINNGIPYPPQLSRQWLRSKILKDSVFSSLQLNKYRLEKVTEYNYETDLNHYNLINGFKASRVLTSNINGIKDYGSEFVYSNFDLLTYDYRLMKRISHDIFNGIDVISTENYFYDNKYHLNPTRIEAINSDGRTIKTVFKYPIDYSNCIDNCESVYQSSINECKNTYSDCAQEVSNCSDKYATCYSQWTICENNDYEKLWGTYINIGNHNCPQKLEDCLKSNGYYTCLTNSDCGYSPCIVEANSQYLICKNNYYQCMLNNYDTATDPNLKAIYLMALGHNQNRLVEKIVYINDIEIDHYKFSFLKQDNIPVALVSKVEKETNNQGFNLEAQYDLYDSFGNIQQITLKAPNNCSSYLWGYNNMYPVAKIDNSTYATLSSNATFMSYINQLQNYTNLIDANTRNNLKTLNNIIRSTLPNANAFISTYTYDPLIGMTSQTDPNGVTTYYEYDTFGRLKLIRDDDGNILKTYEYNYKQ